MANRNFWVDASIDGRKNDLTGGPRNKEGGMNLTMKQLNEGARNNILEVNSWTTEIDGKLILATRINVYDKNGVRIYSTVIETER